MMMNQITVLVLNNPLVFIDINTYMEKKNRRNSPDPKLRWQNRRKIAANEHGQLGDTTTLADPSVVDSLVDNRKNI